MLTDLVGEVIGMQRHPISISHDGDHFDVQIGPSSYSASYALNPMTEEPARLVGMNHPAGNELNIANVNNCSVSLMGVEYGGKNLSGFHANFSWSA